MTQINRTPFRKVVDIPAHILTSDKLKWDSTGGGLVVLTTDGKRYAYLGPDGKIGSWWDSTDATLRPHGLSWEAAEKFVRPQKEPIKEGRQVKMVRMPLGGDNGPWHPEWGVIGSVCTVRSVNTSEGVAYVSNGFKWPLDCIEAVPQPKPQPAKTDEPFRPGLPPAELRAVCKEWEWRCHGGCRASDFVGDYHRFLDTQANGRRRTPQEMSDHAQLLPVSQLDHFRPLGKTWAEVEALAAAKQKPRKHPVPIGGWVMRTDDGYPGVPSGTKAQVEGINEAGSYKVRLLDGRQHVWAPTFCEPCEPPEPKQEPTYIVACPKGRRKYVKYYLSQHIYTGNKDLDALPYSAADKPFYMGYVSAKLREELTALAPDIRFSVG